MTNEITTYNFNLLPIRTLTISNEPYFCLSDACNALGLSNSRKTKTQLNVRGVTKSYIPTKSGNQELTFINEPNLYRLIFRSNKPQAQAFADWVYNEVLPSIRKTGSYGVPAVDMKAIGGMVKKCCAVAVKEELERQALNPMLPLGGADKVTVEFIAKSIDYIVNGRVQNELNRRLTEVKKLLS